MTNLQQRLGPREFEVLRLMATEGLNVGEVSERLCIAGATVSTHIGRLCRKLQARHAYHAISLYWKWREPGDREFQSWGAAQ